ncbi:MAG TPA: HlyD family efflux transporter periplasmic adaptor subunit [Terriglobales bacterium]|nr:HlyD family efflux transporter periplasmic adaptor subunit [Terriglobales bacterium]
MTATPQPVPSAAPARPLRFRRRRKLGWLWGSLALALAAGALAGMGWRFYQSLAPAAAAAMPTAQVQRGEVRLEVYALGTLKGGHSELLVAPPVAGGPLSIRMLRSNGAQVHAGEVVVAFDTAAQEYNLTQAREALQQAQQQVIQAQANADAQTEDDHYQAIKAEYDVQRAELQVRRNPLLATVDAKKNDLTLAAARAHLAQLQKDAASRQASNAASIAVQQAAERKAQADAATAEHNIASMTLRAQHDGYVSVRQNTSTSFLFAGMSLPPYQVGDTVRPGQAVVEIPDTSTWEVDLEVNELDAGHLAPGEPVAVRFIAFPGQTFAGRLQSEGAVGGPPWARQVAVVVQLLHPTPALRPGLSVTAVITTAVLPNVLWAPSQAVFDAGAGSYAYLRVGGQFQRQRVTVTQRSESQVVLQGLHQGDVIALANPEDQGGGGGRAPAAASQAGGPTLPGGRGR